MKIFRIIATFGFISLPLFCCGQVYQAGQRPALNSQTFTRWDISLGAYHSNIKLVDPAQETLLSKEAGASLRGLYAFSSWFLAGAEGGITKRENFPVSNTYRHTYYGLVTKWILTPQTKPQVYLLLGGGRGKRELSYAGNWSHTITKPYITAGTGVELDIGSLGYIGLEAQARYNTSREVDAFCRLNHRLETVFGLRGGVRF